MARKVDREVLLGFVDEAKGYLPRILKGIDNVSADAQRLDSLEEIHRLSHSIKGAASMMGLAGLGHIAFYVEESLEQIGAGQLSMEPATASVLKDTVAVIDRYLDDTVADRLQERPLLERVVTSFRRLRGLPESGDREELDRLLPAVDELAGAPARAEESEILLEDETVAPELMEAFGQEAEDHLQHIGAGLKALEKAPSDREHVQAVRRRVHTLKGASGMVGLTTLSGVAHRMEDLLDQLFEGGAEIPRQTLDLLFETNDAMEDLAKGERPGSISKLYQRYAELLEEFDATPPELMDSPLPAATPLEPLGAEPMIDLEEMAAARPADVAKPAAAVAKPEARASQVVRVPIDRLDELVRLVSELVVSRSTFEQYFQGLIRESGELGLSSERLPSSVPSIGERVRGFGSFERPGARAGRGGGHGASLDFGVQYGFGV